MNYIKHLSAVFERFNEDHRLNASHISIYYALFQYWNLFRFREQFYVQREEIMQASKIGSLSTYHKCIRELDTWNYILYMPSNNPLKGSQVKMSIFWTSDEQVENRQSTSAEQPLDEFETFLEQVAEENSKSSEIAVVYETNNIKQLNNNKQPKDRQPVIDFFKEKGFPANEGKKFFEHYQRKDWKTKNNMKVLDWQALAIYWMNRAELYGKEKKESKKGASHAFPDGDNLKTTKYKDYGQPL